MSPSRSKAKDKRASGKEPPKSATKPTTGGAGGPAGGYNPLLGTFHTLETTPVATLPPVNGRFRDIDDTDDPSGNAVGINDSDSISNNGSWSGESEDPKDKASSQGTTASRHETAVSGVDNDKREKIRQKNEKKHQRQKERRAQELHDKCCGYLMSRKLEALAQKLVAMGFPLERATMALIMNEGRVEESVAWLFESGEDSGDHREHHLDTGGNLKVDISQELAQIGEMEIKFKCSKQEVERAVVACEGDLQQAAENLIKLQKQESQAPPPKSGESPAVGKPSLPVTPVTTKVQSKRTLSSGAMPIQKPDDKDLNYPTITAPAGRLVAESGTKNIQLLKKAQPVSDWTKPTSAPEKRWPVNGLSNGLSPSGSFSLAAPRPSKTEILGNEIKNLQLGSVVMMQRPQSKQIPTTSMSPSSSSHFSDWNSGEPPLNRMNSGGLSHMPTTTTTRSFNNTTSYGNSIGNQYDQFHYQYRHQSPPQNYVPTPTLAAASSLGLFSGLGSPGAGAGAGAAHVDWNGDWSSQFDYTNIDWSLKRIPSPSSLRPNGMWMGSSGSGSKVAVRPVAGNGFHHADGVGVGVVGGGSEAASGGSREWTSPFEEKDLFSLPRKFVSSPTL